MIVVRFLRGRQLLECGLARLDSRKQSEVLESFDAGREDDQDACRSVGHRTEGMRHESRNRHCRTGFDCHDLISGHQTQATLDDIEHLGRLPVKVRCGAVDTRVESYFE